MHVDTQGRRLETLLATLEERTREAEARAALAVRREAAAAEALAGVQRTAEQRPRPKRRDPARRGRGGAALLADARRQVGQELERLKGDETRRRRAAQEAYRQLRSAEAALQPARRRVTNRRRAGRSGSVAWDSADVWSARPMARSPCRPAGLTVRVARSEIEPASGGTPITPATSVSLPSREDAPREIHLLGLTTDEARTAVEKFLDDAALAGHREVRVVHGKGTGALRRAVEGLPSRTSAGRELPARGVGRRRRGGHRGGAR